MFRFIKTTIVGGVLFLVPIVIFIAIIGKAIELTARLAAPLATHLPDTGLLGVPAEEFVALLIIVIACFAAGLAARTNAAAKLVQSLENNILDKVPAYALMKAKTGSILKPEDTEGMSPVLIAFDDSWQIGYEIEKLNEDKCLVYLPGAPDPWSGSICAVSATRLHQIDISITDVTALMKRLGKGSPEALRQRL